MEPSSGMRDYVKDRIREIGEADILVGIPCYNEEKTISNVITTASQGLVNHYPELKSVIIVSDGGSLDDTREKAKEAKVDSRVEKIVTIYRGLPGKGTSFRLIFETAEKLKCKACCVFDSDLRSISPDWVRFLISPILDRGFDYVTPWYIRDKYDGTITNNICYPMTRALYGLRIRQPIGGDFGFSGSLASFYAHEEVWQSNVAKFGIDIWMTTTALNEGFKVCQAHMGAKVHEVKDPSTLGIMFVQVVGTLFGLMGKYRDKWRKVKQSRPTELFGEFSQEAPPRVEVSLDKLLREIKAGWKHFHPLWMEILSPETLKELAEVVEFEEDGFKFPASLWARVVYDFAYTYTQWENNRHKLVDIMAPLYYGRAASFVLETKDMDNQEAEKVIEEQAEEFERQKPYLVERFELWEEVV